MVRTTDKSHSTSGHKCFRGKNIFHAIGKQQAPRNLDFGVSLSQEPAVQDVRCLAIGTNGDGDVSERKHGRHQRSAGR